MSGFTSDSGSFLSTDAGEVLVSSGADTGSQSDILARLQRWLPTGWFPWMSGPGARLYAHLAGFASVLASVYTQIGYTSNQTRIATATDGWLDLVSQDYFGGTLPRLPNETDTAFRVRIKANLFVPRATRPALVQVLTNLTGNTPTIVYPWHPGDVGNYYQPGYAALGYGGPGYYGSLAMPAQSFVTVATPSDGIHTATASDIYAAISETIPEGAQAWVDVT